MALATKRLLRYLKTYPDGGISFGVNRFESDQPTVGEQMQKLFDDKSLYGEMGFGVWTARSSAQNQPKASTRAI